MAHVQACQAFNLSQIAEAVRWPVNLAADAQKYSERGVKFFTFSKPARTNPSNIIINTFVCSCYDWLPQQLSVSFSVYIRRRCSSYVELYTRLFIFICRSPPLAEKLIVLRW